MEQVVEEVDIEFEKLILFLYLESRIWMHGWKTGIKYGNLFSEN
jgi:hypothetical protein